jgi:hypothetical protein
LSCLCSDVEDFTHLFLLFMITGMFPNPIHRSETCNERYHCNIHMTACFTAIWRHSCSSNAVPIKTTALTYVTKCATFAKFA